MGKKEGKRASNSMAFLFTTGALLLVVLVSLSFPSPADAFGRVPNFKLKSPSPPPKKPIYMPPTPTKRPIYVPSTPPKKSPPLVPKKPPHYVPSKPPKKPVKPMKPKSPPPPYQPDLTTAKIGIPNIRPKPNIPAYPKAPVHLHIGHPPPSRYINLSQ
ncbi:non-classical arabinogalactan protein 31-like [Papaver somniferum]|uniref:non-classical arabinogalactan protein 31-like n=1 Tax=Papaver somniferum TaxID=3469 RepID=UPI000E6F8B59|nr:non-classical arabinogalactan protein 31-like [Papaver somniferum]